jgi:transposase
VLALDPLIAEKIAQLEAEIEALRRANERLRSEIADKTTIIQELLRRLHGKKSEKRPKTRTPAGGTPPADGSAPPPPKRPTPGHGRAPFDPKIPRETETREIPADKRKCTTCDELLVEIGEDVCERGHVVPVTVTVRRWVSKKYGCPHGHMIMTAEGAPQGLVDRAKWTTETYAFVVVAKYGDHMPLDRLEASLKRQGVDLPKSTMADMVQVVGERVAPILDQAKKELLEASHLQADETPLDYAIDGQRGTKQGYLWAWRAGEKLLFEFDPTRKGNTATQFLGAWRGTLQTDGYQGYDAVVAKNDIIRAGCWSHTRRKFNLAADLKSEDAQRMLALIARLYWLEAATRKRARRRGLGAAEAKDLLRRVRDRRSRRMAERIKTFRDELALKPEIVPKSPLGKAVIYMGNQWPALVRFLDDPEIEIDTNAIERAIRPIALGRKNWNFAGSTRGAVAAARLFSIINVCKALDIDPYAYLVDVLEQVSPHADFARLTPWAWAKAHPNAAAATSAG